MPIVNGTYVYDAMPTGNGKTLYEQVFPGTKYSRKDWSDDTTAAYNYLLKQQEQAYNLDLWNLANEYNSPAAQMMRYQDAGLNPFLIYGQQNTAQSPASASAPSFRSQGTHQKAVANAMSMIGEIMQTVKAARDTYDYMTYGRETNRWQMINAQEQALGQKMSNAWSDWMLHGDNMIYGDSTRLPQGPRATMYKYQMDTQKATYDRVRALIGMIPDQKARLKALTALDEHREELMKGQYDWILHGFSTGHETLDAFLRMFMMFGMSSLF